MARKGFNIGKLLLVAGAAGGTLYVVAGKARGAVKEERRQTIDETRQAGRELVREGTDEAILVAGHLDAKAQDLASLSRVLRDGLEFLGFMSSEERLKKEQAASDRFMEIRAIFREAQDKGHLTSARLHDLGKIIAWNDARVASDFTGRTVINPDAISFAKQLMAEAKRKKVVIYTCDVLAAKIMSAARGRGYVKADELFDVDEYDPPRALINMLDRNEWAHDQDTSSRQMWYQVLSPKTEALVRGFVSDVKAGRLSIMAKGMPISWSKFADEYLPPE